MTARRPLSVLITTYDEAEMLPLCLAPIKDWADEIVVVDSGSQDGTIEIAQSAGAVVLHHAYQSPARQKNWGLAQCRHPWVLILDADEVVTPELRTELEALLEAGPKSDGYWIGRDNLFLGRWMRHGGWETDAVIRFVQRDRARYDDRMVHEEIDLPGPLPRLTGRLRHHTFRSIEQYWPKVRRYAQQGALQAFQQGRRASASSVLLHTVGRFTKMYLLRQGFLDGGHGLVLALFSSFTTYLKYAHLWELTRQQQGAPRSQS